MFEEYLLYLTSYVREKFTTKDDPVSPFSYEEWIMCGMPMSYNPGIRLEDNQYITIINSDDSLVGYVKLDERMASVIAEGISSGRFKIGKKDSGTRNSLPGEGCNSI